MLTVDDRMEAVGAEWIEAPGFRLTLVNENWEVNVFHSFNIVVLYGFFFLQERAQVVLSYVDLIISVLLIF